MPGKRRYPEIGDRPKKVLSNPPEGSIEALKGLSSPKRVYRTPFWAPKRFYRTLVRGTSEPQTGFYRTFRIEPPLFRLSFKNSPYRWWIWVPRTPKQLKTCKQRENPTRPQLASSQGSVASDYKHGNKTKRTNGSLSCGPPSAGIELSQHPLKGGLQKGALPPWFHESERCVGASDTRSMECPATF